MRRYEQAEHAFTLDPVDGTKNFVRGSPDHAMMLAEVVAGVVERAWVWQPQHQAAYVAERGRGTWRNGERLTVAAPADPPRGAVSARGWVGRRLGDLPALSLTWVCCGDRLPPPDRRRLRLPAVRPPEALGPRPHLAAAHRGRRPRRDAGRAPLHPLPRGAAADRRRRPRDLRAGPPARGRGGLTDQPGRSPAARSAAASSSPSRPVRISTPGGSSRGPGTAVGGQVLGGAQPADHDGGDPAGVLARRLGVDRGVVLAVVTDQQPGEVRQLGEEPAQLGALVLAPGAEDRLLGGSPVGQQQRPLRGSRAGAGSGSARARRSTPPWRGTRRAGPGGSAPGAGRAWPSPRPVAGRPRAAGRRCGTPPAAAAAS